MKTSKSNARSSKNAATSRDLTKYKFAGQTLNKRHLALEVIKDYAHKHPKLTFEKLTEAFPGMVRAIRDARDKSRYFVSKEDIITTADGVKAVVSNQMRKNMADKLVSLAKQFGYKIRKAA